MTDWNALRAHFPALEDRVYLNTAGGGPMGLEAVEAAGAYYDEFYREGDTQWGACLERIEDTRAQLARVLNTSPRDVAFLGNASQGLNLVADMLDGNVVAFADDFPSVTMPWLQRGRSVRFLDSPEVTDDALETDILAVSFVQYKTGYRLDLKRTSELCRSRNVRLVIDATQGFGAFPIDLERTPVDALVFSGYKWANAGYGIAPLYVSRALLEGHGLPAAGWRSAKKPYDLEATKLDLTTDARGLELGHPPFASVFALGGALDLIESIGLEAIDSRVQDLVDALHRGLDARGIAIDSPRERDRRSGIVMVRVPDPVATAAALAEKSILVSARGEGLRVSLHYYNNEDDIERFLDAL
ncbi:MAG: aminotransferase class V-fold PLP-dependent enzyme [Acidobacteriota bacterium]|nr:MAG: aminotransferase class V-fold PLP-dependent enzyme [Acidobacteriota bacterium]